MASRDTHVTNLCGELDISLPRSTIRSHRTASLQQGERRCCIAEGMRASERRLRLSNRKEPQSHVPLGTVATQRPRPPPCRIYHPTTDRPPSPPIPPLRSSPTI